MSTEYIIRTGYSRRTHIEHEENQVWDIRQKWKRKERCFALVFQNSCCCFFFNDRYMDVEKNMWPKFDGSHPWSLDEDRISCQTSCRPVYRLNVLIFFLIENDRVVCIVRFSVCCLITKPYYFVRRLKKYSVWRHFYNKHWICIK